MDRDPHPRPWFRWTRRLLVASMGVMFSSPFLYLPGKTGPGDGVRTPGRTPPATMLLARATVTPPVPRASTGAGDTREVPSLRLRGRSSRPSRGNAPLLATWPDRSWRTAGARAARTAPLSGPALASGAGAGDAVALR